MNKVEEVFRCALKYKSKALISHFNTPFKIDFGGLLAFFPHFSRAAYLQHFIQFSAPRLINM